MENKFIETMAVKTDDELREMFKNNHKYVPEALSAALIQLNNRGITIEGSEQIIQESKTKEVKKSIINDTWDTHQHVEDESAPLLYSKRVIYSFSFLFSVVFGAVLILLNLRALKKSEGVIPTISFSLSYLATIVLVSNYIETHYNAKLPFGNVFSFLGAWLILELVWNKYIGKEIQYRKKGIAIPLVIGLVVTTLYILVLFLQK